MNYYPIKLAGVDRKLPICPVTEDLYIGAFVIFGDPELTTACAKELLKKGTKVLLKKYEGNKNNKI